MISVTRPISQAFDTTGRILFKNVTVGKWFVLALPAFMAYYWSEAGGPNNFLQLQQAGAAPGQNHLQWLMANMGIALGIVLVIALPLMAVMSWLAGRGHFMFLDGVARNDPTIKRSWSDYRQLGNNLAVVIFFIDFIQIAVFLGAFAIGTAIAWPDIQTSSFGSASITGIVVGGLIALAMVLITVVLRFFLLHFIVPAMYIRNCRWSVAWDAARTEIITKHPGSIVGFFFMRVLIGIATAAIATMAMAFTCCLVALPYIGTVIMLPIYVFELSYTLHFIEQFGPRWAIFSVADVEEPPTCAECGYDLTGLDAERCPECGASTEPPEWRTAPPPPDAPPTSPT